MKTKAFTTAAYKRPSRGLPVRASDAAVVAEIFTSLRNMDLQTGTYGGVPWWNKLPWHFRWTASDKVKVQVGALRITGKGIANTTETEITFTGATEWIYVQQARGGTTATIEHSATEPQSTATHFRKPLYKFLITAAGVYYLAYDARFDCVLDLPLR